MLLKPVWVMALCGLWGLLSYPLANADLLGVTASPKQSMVSLEENRTLNIRWVISTDPAHQAGAASAQGLLRDITTNTLLKTLNLPLNNPTGSGPIHFEETLEISAEEAQQWREMGYLELEYRRNFTVAGGSGSTQAAVSISIMTPEAELTEKLVLQDIQLSFKPQRFNRIVALNLPLQAQATLRYSGLGAFSGSWQIAHFNPQEQSYQYKMLAEASKNLEQRNQDFLLSPRLPTDQPGHYRLRFCPKINSIDTQHQIATDTNCPLSQLNTALEYEVVEDKSTTPVSANQDDKQRLTASALFSWPAENNAVVYELVLHQVAAKEAVTSAPFLGRMLISASAQSTRLSPEILSVLVPGSQYSWRVNAYDYHGELIKQTAPKTFVFLP